MQNKTISKKPGVRKAVITQTLPTLVLWENNNQTGRRLRFRGNLGVRTLVIFNFNDLLSSFVFTGNRNSTLVLFRDINYQGPRRVFRGSIEVDSLPDFNDQTSSFIMSRRRLTNAEIDDIQARRVAPENFAEVLGNGTVAMNRKNVKR
ncbi:peptidase inhibitor family I36 protein [Paenibacillus hexagrammi]|uniref:Peptidase inhibitor family I36 protein n=1 Tax=Paenibacillus hexagrammi TaxID=2908839 RepID=A0ABY3SNV2_9BACL|nr:peptidase inhibitor family I36 protein [Paenibacillus sp. YPD9-1]UJF35639.1 peptidase inhibitor family I36 protein [Paenibacillus sp. YPD9-1]